MTYTKLYYIAPWYVAWVLYNYHFTLKPIQRGTQENAWYLTDLIKYVNGLGLVNKKVIRIHNNTFFSQFKKKIDPFKIIAVLQDICEWKNDDFVGKL